MSMQITLQVQSTEVSALRDRLQQRVDSARQEMVRTAMTTTLDDVIDHTPVETGQAKSAWQSELSRINGTLPSSIASEAESLSATNDVEHVVYLEYGTTRMMPRSTVRNAIARIGAAVSSMFRFSF